MKKKNGWLGKAAAGLVVVLALVWWLGSDAAFGGGSEEVVEGARVQYGPLSISVVERGNLKAAKSIDLVSEVEGQTAVLYLIDEGVEVEPGDLLCELDTSELIDSKVQQEIAVQNVEAEYIKAQQNHQIQESQNESDIARAERELEFARIDLQKYLEGDVPQELQSAEEEIVLSDEELTRAEQDLEWSEKLAAKGFLEQTQLEADRLKKTRAEIAVNQARRAKELLEDYEIPRTTKELEAEVEEKMRELERVKLQARARIADYDADVRTSKARFDLEKEDLSKLESQIAKARIHAPVAGMVVYAIENSHRWGGGEPMREGAMVRERQKILTIPSSEGFVAEVSLHESVLEKVMPGMPCLVTVDALPGRTYRGEVSFKALLPDQNSYWANPDLRVYRTEVRVVDSDGEMRPGMSCSVEILVDDIPRTHFVPVQAVFLDGGSPVCLVREAGNVEKRPVEVGQNNAKWVEIRSGLEKDEVVLLSQPPGITLEPAAEEEGRDDSGRFGEGRPEGGGGRGPAPATASGERGDGRPEGRRGERSGEQRGAGEERGQVTAEQAERFRKMMEEDPERAARIREAMGDPEKMRAFRERQEKMMGAGGADSGGVAGDQPAGHGAAHPGDSEGGGHGEPTAEAATRSGEAPDEVGEAKGSQ